MSTLDLTTLTLAAGEHDSGSSEMCLLEAVSYIAGEPWSDQPECVSPVLGMYGRRLNDALPDETRQRLVPFIPRLLNTVGDGLDERRSYLALDWLTRTHLPAWLRLVPALVGQAELIAAAPEVTDLATANWVGVLVREAASQANATWIAAGPGTWVAAQAADRATWAAAGRAVRAATGPAAGDVARAATGPAAGDVAGAAAQAAARVVTWTVTWNAAEAFLAPTVAVLQDSAISLFDRMLTATK